MKKTRLFLFALTAMIVAFSGCSKDDEDDFSMVGTWTQESSLMVIDLGDEDLDNFTFEDNDPVTIVFEADGTGTATDDGVSEDFTWELTGNTLAITDPVENYTMNLTLTTMTDTRVVGEQNLTQAELIAMGGLSEEELGLFESYPDLTAEITITLVK
ncbi:MAG: lipocalin family protein [Bacteroidota bacterium]